jgi:toxin ParE1/3/4
MNRRILKKPQVECDLVEHYSYIARDKIAPADRFLEAAQELFERLASEPQLGHIWQSPLRQLAGVRVCPIPSPYGNYLVFYRPIEDGVEILTVIHGSRDLQAVLKSLAR